MEKKPKAAPASTRGEGYPYYDNDLARDNTENDLPESDRQDLKQPKKR